MTSKTQTYELEGDYGRDKLVFTFHYSIEKNQVMNVEVQLVSQENPGESFFFHMGEPQNEKQIPFDHTFPDGLRVYGYLKFVSEPPHTGLPRTIIWGDFHYGRRSDDLNNTHFTGAMVGLDTETE